MSRPEGFDRFREFICGSGLRNEGDLPPRVRALMSLPGSSAAISFDTRQLEADDAERLEERGLVKREVRLLRGPKATQPVSLWSRLNRIPAGRRTGEDQGKIEAVNECYRKAYVGSELYLRLFSELQAAAAGMEGIEVKETKRLLEETAVEVLRAAGEMGR